MTEALERIHDEYFDRDCVEHVNNYIDFLESKVYSSK